MFTLKKYIVFGILSILLAFLIIVIYIFQKETQEILKIPQGPTGKYPIQLMENTILPSDTKITTIQPTKGHHIPLTIPNNWILYIWGPGKWNIDTGWIIKCKDRYYAPEQGYGVLLRDPYEILPLQGETDIKYLLAIEPI